MPIIPQLTASGQAGNLSLPRATADSFGAQAGQGALTFGQSLMALDAKQREQQDRLDLARLAGEYEVESHRQRQQILAEEPNVHALVPTYTEAMGKYKAQLLKEGDYSRTVHTAFLAHTEGADARGSIEIATEGRKLQGQRQIGQYATIQPKLSLAAALAGPGQREKDLMRIEEDLRNGLVASGAITPEQGVKLGETAQNDRWTIAAQQTPERIIGIMQSGELPEGMDPARQHVYTELAFQSMAAQQRQHDQAMKDRDARVKEIQEATARDLTADIIEGKSVAGEIPGLLRGRSLTDNDGRTLLALEKAIKAEPDLTKYQPSLAAQIEASLGAMKFQPGALSPHVEQNLVSEFIEGHILKEEFTHLMGIWRGVQEYRAGEGKEAQNKEIGRAERGLRGKLETTGPADKFDALSRQAIEDASEFFFRQMSNNPQADPWQIKKQAEEIYQPVIEQRLNLSEQDKMKLNDAKMRGLKESKVITPAAYDAWNKREQDRRGHDAVQKALKELPPPKEPSFWERINPFKPKEKAEPPKRKPGVMRGQ